MPPREFKNDEANFLTTSSLSFLFEIVECDSPRGVTSLHTRVFFYARSTISNKHRHAKIQTKPDVYKNFLFCLDVDVTFHHAVLSTGSHCLEPEVIA